MRDQARRPGESIKTNVVRIICRKLAKLLVLWIYLPLHTDKLHRTVVLTAIKRLERRRIYTFEDVYRVGCDCYACEEVLLYNFALFAIGG